MAENTVDNVLQQVRTILQDKVAPLRYSDEELLDGLNTAFLELRRLRPDAFIGILRDPLTELVVGGLIPTDQIFFPGLVYYTAGNAELRDDSFTQDNRAGILMVKAANEWVGK